MENSFMNGLAWSVGYWPGPERHPMTYSRRELGALALAGFPVARALAAGKKINSKINGVQIGAITWTFNTLASPDPEAIVRAFQEIGLGEVELMSNHCEALAGAPAVPPAGRRGAPLSPDQQSARQAAQEKLTQWRASTNAGTWKAVTKKFNDAGVDVALLCYNMQDSMKDDDIEYGFSMAKGLGAKAISTSTTLTMAKRIAPIADRHKLMVGYHGHDATNDPNQTATLESYDTLMKYGGYNGINLDIGHFTAAGYDAVAFIKQHHDRITNLHVKDRKKNHGATVAEWGTGDTPIKEVLQLLRKEHYPIPANLELEYTIPEGSNIVAETKKCFAYVKSCLA
jgi:sugar phosphate isomerase/epimerase